MRACSGPRTCGARLPRQLLSRPAPATHPSITYGQRRHLWSRPAISSASQGPADDLSGNVSKEAAGPVQKDAEIAELKKQLARGEQELQEQAQRMEELAPYLVGAPKYGVLGSSRFAERLRKDVVNAATDKERKAVVIFGEPGLEKDNIAALIHAGSPDHSKPMAQVECADVDEALLYGQGEHRGLLYWLQGGGTLLLNNIHRAKLEAVPLLQKVLSSQGALPGKEGEEDPGAVEGPRIIMTEEQPTPALEKGCMVIKVPPLRARGSDIRPHIDYFLKDYAAKRGLGDLALTDTAVRKLESYSFPLNIEELRELVERAAVQATGPTLPDEVFWRAATRKDLYRLNLLDAFPELRKFLRGDVWPEGIKYKFVAPVFALVVTVGYLGPQDRDHSFVLNAFWAYWWPLIFLVYPFLGRVWCAVCPFMLYGEIVQRLRLSMGAKLMKWPHEPMEKWGPWFLFSLFAAILVWEEVWDLPNSAYLSASLLLVITAGAVVCSWFFERRLWCRYLCPVGGMNGLFGKLAMTEVRAPFGVCQSECSTYTCYKGGGPVAPEGLKSTGCPLYSHPAHLDDNKDCVLCMECLKACPHRSVEFNLRVPGVDLWTTHKPTEAEAALLFMLLGAVMLHHLPQLMGQFGLDPELAFSWKGPHILASLIVLALPGALCYSADQAWRKAQSAPPAPAAATLAPAGAGAAAAGGAGGASNPAVNRALAVLRSSAGAVQGGGSSSGRGMAVQPFVEACYGYTPLVWAATLAHYLDNLLRDAGRILPVTALTFGIDAPWLPAGSANPIIISFLQGTTLTLGCALSLLLTKKIGGKKYGWQQQAHQLALTVLLTAELWALIVK